MKNLFFLSFIFLASFGTLQGQGFYKVLSPNGADVWAVGNAGRVFRSSDGGNTWGSLTLGVAHLRSFALRANEIQIVGDGGLLYKNSGGAVWTVDTVASVSLRAITYLTDSVGIIVGYSGTILRTDDAGQTWGAIASPLNRHLRAMAFVDSLRGWIAGDSGTVLTTMDGGAGWIPVEIPGMTKDLFSIAARGDTVIVSGADAAGARSYNSGATWSMVNFKIESQSDVTKTLLLADGAFMYCGGGGFIRKTYDGGQTFSFQKNPMLASLSDMYFYDDQKGWACSDRTNAIVRTDDGGATWLLPTGTTVNDGWSQKLSTGLTVRGHTLAINAFDKRVVYVALGNRVYQSRDIGEAWTQIATIPNGIKTNSFYVSPNDTNLFVAAFGSPDVITRSTDRGATWTTTLARGFTEYGMPLEMDPNDPTRLYFGPEDSYLYRSTNFGLTWDSLSRPMFRSPCDLMVVYEKPNVLLCGDGITGSGNGQIFRSDDAGRSWNLIVTVSGSEVPTIGGSWIDNNLAYATAWSSGGVRRSVDQGVSWQQIQTTGAAWGVDVAKDDPLVAMYGVYSGSTSYLTSDRGQTWTTTSLSGSNYAFLCYDRATILAMQSGGVYKYTVTYSVPVINLQTISVLQPAPGTVWGFNTVQNITWSSGNIINVKIDYKTSPTAPWQTITASTPAPTGSYAWTIPSTPTTQARVRISDAADGIPADSSGLFTIIAPAISVTPPAMQFGGSIIGTSRWDTLRITNSGSATLVISNVYNDSSVFAPGRTSFSIPPGASDTLSVTFTPSAVQAYRDTLRILNNSANGVLGIPLSGQGLPDAHLAVLVPNGGETWQYHEMRAIMWSSLNVSFVRLDFKTHPDSSWEVVADSVAADTGSYVWSIPNAPATQARVRITDLANNVVVDSSDGVFSIVVPGIAVTPNELNFGNVPAGQQAADTLTINNSGTASLIISQISIDSAGFAPSRTSMVVPAGTSDTLTIRFSPVEVRSYSATLYLFSNSPDSLITVLLAGVGTTPVAVEQQSAVPTRYSLEQNYPNPFNPSTTIVFDVPRESHVTLKVYNPLGQEVRTLVNSVVLPGRHGVEFDASHLPSGLYFYRIVAGESSSGHSFVDTKRMLLIK